MYSIIILDLYLLWLAFWVHLIYQYPKGEDAWWALTISSWILPSYSAICMTSFPLHTPFNGVFTRPLITKFFSRTLKAHVPTFLMKLNSILKSNCKQNSPENVILLVNYWRWTQTAKDEEWICKEISVNWVTCVLSSSSSSSFRCCCWYLLCHIFYVSDHIY